jgi:hypothetical protein
MPHQPLMPGAAAVVPHDARHLGLMHRKDHRGRGASAPERVTDFDDIADARTLTAELTWNRRAQEALGARGSDRFGRHAGFVVDCGGMLGGNGRNAFGARRQTFFRPRRAAGHAQVPGRAAGRGSGMFGRRPRAHRCTHRCLIRA